MTWRSRMSSAVHRRAIAGAAVMAVSAVAILLASATRSGAAVARRLNATMFVSLHMDSAPNPLARGASVYSLSDVASDAEAARFAAAENGGGAIAEGGA